MSREEFDILVEAAQRGFISKEELVARFRRNFGFPSQDAPIPAQSPSSADEIPPELSSQLTALEHTAIQEYIQLGAFLKGRLGPEILNHSFFTHSFLNKQ